MRLAAKILTALALTALALTVSAAAQTTTPPPLAGAITSHPGWPQPKTSDVDSVDHILAALYDVISGPAHQPRDWNRFRSLFVPDARLIPIRIVPGTPDLKTNPATDVIFLTPDTYVARASAVKDTEGFFERSIRNEIDRFGNLVSVFSTYESRHALTDAKPFARGINSIQILKDGSRYWIIDICWDAETPTSQIPPRYLPKAGAARLKDEDEGEAALTGLDVSKPTQYFAGDWSGKLEHEGGGSAVAASLPAKLAIKPSTDGRAMTFNLTFDYGGGKLVADKTMITLFPLTSSATITDMQDHTSQSYALTGLKEFSNTNLGQLILNGMTKEDDKPVDVRITFSLTPGQLTWTRATRPAGSPNDFQPRDRYTFTHTSASSS